MEGKPQGLPSTPLKKPTVLAPTYSCSHLRTTTIGAGGLNCCVRDGNRCDPAAKGTRTLGF